MTVVDKIKEWGQPFSPYGLLSHSIYLIVGEFGFVVEWINPDYTKGQRRFKKGDEILVVRIQEDIIYARVTCDEMAVHQDFFMGVKQYKS